MSLSHKKRTKASTIHMLSRKIAIKSISYHNNNTIHLKINPFLQNKYPPNTHYYTKYQHYSSSILSSHNQLYHLIIRIITLTYIIHPYHQNQNTLLHSIHTILTPVRYVKINTTIKSCPYISPK